MEYKLLQFNQDYSSIHSLISLGWISSNDISNYENDGEYDHQGFEYEYNSLQTVCNHAAAMVKRIERDRYSEDEAARKALRRDYKNAIKCLKLGNQGERDRIDLFTQYMLLNDWEVVINAITELHEYNTILKREELVDIDCIPDYGRLLIKAGDYALFEENNFDKALCEYSIAILNWRGKFGNRNDKYSLEDGTKDKLKSYIELFLAIHEDRYIGDDISFLSNEEKKIITQYRTIIEKDNLHQTALNEIEELVALLSDCFTNMKATKNYNQNHPILDSNQLNALRTIRVIIPKLFKIGLFDEINCLVDESKTIQNSLIDLAIEKVSYLEETEYDWIRIAVQTEEEANKWKLLSAVAKVENDVKTIKRQLLIKEDIPELAYYTSWNTFSHMLPNKNQEGDNSGVGKLSVMHLSYMNDPMEGIVINKYLTEKPEQDGRKQENQPYAFVKCFTQSIDYLPMWKMYGDDATGCCIVVDWNKTKKQNKGKRISLYRVCYLDKTKAGYVFYKGNNKETSEVGETLQKLKEDIKKLRNIEGIWGLSDSLIGSIAYLFKDSSYSYEKEARVMYTYNNYNNMIQETDQTPPKLYVYTDYYVVIKELILGPKFKDVYLWSPYIKSQLEKMNNETNEANYTKLSLSDINYR